MPQPFFKEDNLASYLNYNLKVLKNDFIAFDVLENTEMVNVYIPFVHLNNFFFEKFGSFNYKHSSSVLVETLLKKNLNSNPVDFYVNVENGFIQITVIKQKKLIFYNAFNFKTKEDFIYSILLTAEQLNLNPEEFKLTLMGEIEKESELFTTVYNYVRHVEFYTFKGDSFNHLTEFDHTNFILLNQ